MEENIEQQVKPKRGRPAKKKEEAVTAVEEVIKDQPILAEGACETNEVHDVEPAKSADCDGMSFSGSAVVEYADPASAKLTDAQSKWVRVKIPITVYRGPSKNLARGYACGCVEVLNETYQGFVKIKHMSGSGQLIASWAKMIDLM